MEKVSPSAQFVEIARQHVAQEKHLVIILKYCVECGVRTTHYLANETALDEIYRCQICDAPISVRVR